MEKRKIKDLKEHPLNKIIYGMENIDKLKESIKKYGLITPITITSDNIIISGHRRCLAVKELEYKEIAVNVKAKLKTDNEKAIAVIESNKQREKTNEQKTREFIELKKIESVKSKERQVEHGDTAPGKNKTLKENFPEVNKGQARDKAAKEIGWSGKTAEKAEKIIDIIDQGNEEDSKEYTNILNKSVYKAYKKAKKEKKIVVKEKDIPKKTSTFNFTNDNIEWAKWTWNPVTGCKHGCKYCYARDIAKRFDGHFKPTFYEDRLQAPEKTKIPKAKLKELGIHNVFVCSMADLFGEWVPQEWIDTVINVVRNNTQWNFLFLTKNPKRMIDIEWPDNAWIGTTIDKQSRVKESESAFKKIKAKVKFISCEPLNEKIIFSDISIFDWLIIGARSKSTQQVEFQPEWEWVESLVLQARDANVKKYFKPNLTVVPKEYPQ